MAAGKWTVQQAAEMSVAAPTIEASLDGRFVSGLKDERVKAAKFYEQFGVNAPSQLVSFCLNDANNNINYCYYYKACQLIVGQVPAR